MHRIALSFSLSGDVTFSCAHVSLTVVRLFPTAPTNINWEPQKTKASSRTVLRVYVEETRVLMLSCLVVGLHLLGSLYNSTLFFYLFIYLGTHLTTSKLCFF